MQLKPDCFVCLYNQTLRVTKALECEEACADQVLQKIAALLATLDPHQTPPEAAAVLYPKISQIVGKEDLYERQKIESTNKALSLLDFVWERIDRASDELDAALRAAVAGNVIDFATQMSFELEEEIQRIFDASFAIDEKPQFIEKLSHAKSLVVIGDNVGEHVFDKVMIEVFKERFEIDVYYFVRGRPIINDVTIVEAAEIDMPKVCEVVDTGVDTPGFIYERANKRAQELFDSADLILSKGMGNFECLEGRRDDRLYYLFKIKCSVVAGRVGKNIGDLICGKNL
ncbi:MAG: hypothetical protein C6H99_07785 [Epsilonproteobacteria bacterium]|nr:hypothetical protein [Campylobacterota bacterium]NPA64385.1 DUF89 family protein [Campylobacterota bacterium]